MISKIRKLGFDINLKDIFRYQTIDKQYKWLKNVKEHQSVDGDVDDVNQSTNDHIKILNYGDTEPPIFVIPGSPGFTEPYEEIAKCFDHICMVYGIQTVGLKSGEEPLDNIIEIARLNNKWVKEVQPEGPYRYIGHSVGAHIAFEMARQLELDGDNVELITVLDKSANELKSSNTTERIKTIRAIIIQILENYNLKNSIQTQLIDDLIIQLASYDLYNLKGLAKFCTDYLRGPLENQKINVELVMRVMKLQIIHHFIEYIPNSKINSNILVIKASEVNWSMTDDSLGWLEYSDNVYSTISSGSHGSMIDQPNAASLGEKIKKIIKELNIISN